MPATINLKVATEQAPATETAVAPALKIKKRRNRKSKSKITNCEHVGDKYYSKGMCKLCYNKRGRTKLATECVHTQRVMYARKVCKACYLKIYHRKSTS